MKYLSLIAFLLSFTACGSSDDQKPASTSLAQTFKTSDYKVNGKIAEDYYNQFRHAHDENGTEYYLVSDQMIPISKAGSRKTYARLALLLKEQNVFILKYEELRDSGDKSPAHITHSQKLSGQWHVEQTKLVIGDLAEGLGIDVAGKDALKLRFSKKIHEDGLTQHSFILNFHAVPSGAF